MDKLFSFFGKFLSVLPYYPRWALFVFAVSVALLLTSVCVAAVLYFPAAKQQESCEPPSEVRTTIDNQLKGLVEIYQDLGLSLSGWYSSVITFRSHLLAYTQANPDVQQYLQKPLPDDLRRDEEQVVLALDRLKSSLMAVHRQDLAVRSWRAAAEKRSSSLQYVRDELISRGFSDTEATVNVGDIPYLAQFLSVAASKLSSHTFLVPLTAVLSTNSADIPAVGKSINNENLRTFLIGGNLLFGFTRPDNKGGVLIVAWGAAMIADIFRAIPDSDVLRAQLEQIHPKHQCYARNLKVDFTQDWLIDQGLNTAIRDLDKRSDLLVFDVPANTPSARPRT
jgi:hypothetical protein